MLKRFLAVFCAAAMLGVACAPFVTCAEASGALHFTASYGTTDGTALPVSDQPFDAAVTDALTSGTANATVNAVSGVPYQLFTVDTSSVSGDMVRLRFDGQTMAGERLALKAYNYTTGAWDTLDAAAGGVTLSAEAPLADYARDGQLRAMATPDFVNNGSNTMIWSTDPQHYVKFDDLNKVYESIHTYMVQEYQAGNIGYVINTGDIVDDMPTIVNSKASSQWRTASGMYEILDNAGVPYGIVTGNHDTGDYPKCSYNYYERYFGSKRYADTAWFGGDLDNNQSHYDLVTIGNVDLVMLYLGYGMEGTSDTIQWANEVLQTYSHRNAIICTHQYLSSRTGDWAASSRAKTIFDEIVTPNENVKMVLCGHDDGVTRTSHQVGDRTVYEVLSDYQFVQLESEAYYADASDPTHTIGQAKYCNGEGYLRGITIDGSSVSMNTFSPFTGGDSPYGTRDTFTLQVDFAQTQRFVTGYGFSAAAAESGLTAAGTPGEAVSVSADSRNLPALIARADNLKSGDYTADSWKALQDAKRAAEKAKSGSDEAIAAAYGDLATAIGALTTKDTGALDRRPLKVAYTFDLSFDAWQNSHGAKSLTADNSYMAAETNEAGALIVSASEQSLSKYPSMKYIEPVTVTPDHGKLYLYLDSDAASGWSLYPTIIQDGKMIQMRWNYIVEQLKDETWDMGNGVHKGVYDLSDALTAQGFDMTQPLTINMVVYTVPGPVTLTEMQLLTGEYQTGLPLWVWLSIGGAVLVAGGAVAVALLYKPKKKQA